MIKLKTSKALEKAAKINAIEIGLSHGDDYITITVLSWLGKKEYKFVIKRLARDKDPKNGLRLSVIFRGNKLYEDIEECKKAAFKKLFDILNEEEE